MKLKKRKFLIFLIFLYLCFPIKSFTEKTTIKELPLEYKKWLEEEVVYIITPTEKEVFLQLKTDRERDLFIKAFWKQRDPTPGTPENEFKKEHYRRLNYANIHFGRQAAKPGWKTDKGRIYIILGEPQDIERIIGDTGIYNTEIWFYQGLTKYGLPPAFFLIFFQKYGSGEYVLYSPINDGPQALMPSYLEDQSNYILAYKALKKINPKLAKISLSLIPGESSRFLRPSLSSDLLIQNIFSLPQREFKDIYAKKFLMYKDIVEVDYTTNYIDSDYSLKILSDPSGIIFIHYVVEIPKFSVQQYKNKYSTHLKINGSVSDLKGKIIYQFERSFTVEFSEAELKKISYRPFNLYDMFPILPGNYKISIIIKNEVSKEFTSLEENIIVSKDKSLYMNPLILGYRKELDSSKSNNLRPFKIGNYQIYYQPKKIFHSRDKLVLVFQVLNMNSNLYENGMFKFEFFKNNKQFITLTKKISSYKNKLNFIEEFILKDFPPAHYWIKVSLLDKNKEILSEWEEFEITPAPYIPRPWVYYRTLLPPENSIYSYILGKQFFNKGEIEKAKVKFENAYYKNPNFLNYAISLAEIYYILKEFDKIKKILQPFLIKNNIPYQVYFLLGKAYNALGEFKKAISIYNEAISRFGENPNLLNSLGDCYYKIGFLEKALIMWKRSLEINPRQSEIKRKIESIKN